jgi:nitroreductase/Pyruvate/2-oxoacid:ferredoxin oxidoreductase delta subunit
MPPIIIDKNLCTRCNTCGTVCVMGIIEKASGSGFPTIPEEKQDYCLKCGHCESFCAQKALTLNFLVEEKLNIAPSDGLIKPENLALYIKKRRSVRHFSSKPVSKELIAQVIDVARYAASGGNGQPVKWLVIYDFIEVKRIAGLTIEWMRTIQNTNHPLAQYVPILISKWDSGEDFICHDAPHVLFAHTPYFEGFDDPTEAIIAMTHFDIAAPSFGLGTCWAGFVKMAVKAYKPLQDALSIPEGRKVACPMLFGYSSYKVISIPRRNPVDITWK